MPRLFAASFEKMTPIQMQQTGLWTVVGSGIVSTTGRTGDGVTGTSGATETQNSLRSRAFAPATPAAGYQGVAVKCTTLPAAERKLWSLIDSSGGALITLTIRTDGKARVYRGTDSGALLATSASAMFAAATWRYIQIGYDFTANTLIVISTNDSDNVSTALYAVPDLVAPLPWVKTAFYVDESIVIDDFYVNDALPGTANNYFSGKTSIVVLDPVSVEYKIAYFPWTPNVGSSDVAVVDDAITDGDATYLYTRQSYSWIRYQMETLADDGRRVDDVQMMAVARVVSAAFQPGMDFNLKRWDGVELFVTKFPGGYNGPVTQTSYTTFCGPTRTGLAGNDWSIARVNDSRFGVRS